MVFETIMWLAAAVVLVFFDVYVSWLVVRSDSFSRGQKIAQAAIVYVIPIFGGILVWAFLKSDGQSAGFDASVVIDRAEKGAGIAVDVINHANN